MANTREPILKPIPVLSLRPTQMTVGMREVKEKRKRWREHKSEKKRAALHEEGVKDILVSVIGDLTMVDREAFWGVMDNKRWVYPYDAKGERCHFKDIP